MHCAISMAAAEETRESSNPAARPLVVLPGGYRALPVRVQQDEHIRYLYVKQHHVRDVDASCTPSKALLVVGIPPYCSQDNLRFLFGKFGVVESVTLHEEANMPSTTDAPSKYFNIGPDQGFKVAVVSFKLLQGAKAALSYPVEEALDLSSNEVPLITGVTKWANEYKDKIIVPEEMQAEIDDYMEKYDKMEEEKARQQKELAVPDEEGWVTVTRKGRLRGIPRTTVAIRRLLQRERKQRAQRELLNFYTWQRRESKRDHIIQLRRKFEEDKQKIALMKAQRKFRPF
uniref:Ribosomal RNA processing 7 homolog A n=1 Tax=Eptatretus burgeri TaxID=7764 RepID=A0A8C4QKM1_EPTBU